MSRPRVWDQSPEELEKFLERARTCARSRGFPDLADDFAQEATITIGDHQTIDQCFIDFLRKRFGRSASKAMQGRLRRDRGYLELSEVIGLAVAQSDSGDFERIVGMLKGPDRALVKLRFDWGLSEVEIADLYGVSGSAVALKLGQILSALRKELEKEGGGMP